jgi:hypothetical protein
MTSSPRQRWSESFADPSGEAFAQIIAADVELDGSIFARPVHGRHAVWTTLRTAAGIYDSLAACTWSGKRQHSACGSTG